MTTPRVISLDVTYLVTEALLLPDPERSRPAQGQADGAPGTTADEIRLTGRLVCRNAAEAAIVAAHLPEHIELTRAERGCLAFEVAATDDPLVWAVDEHFASEDAFATHQARVAGSEWGRSTADIERQYEIRRVAR
ncbi:putative quinol monooxygenase [Herbiconiux sp. YIM B11900]|uniref:putative quinol monooxygenase n=1 Tax=Herbiconiux sp. YIM B11900 TaxID=3404131 RepID=UPI003F8637FA